MKTVTPDIWWLRIATFLTAALAAASAAYWLLKWTASSPQPAGAPVTFSAVRAADPQVVARLLGGGQTAALPVESVASHFKLTGVVADRRHSGYALISIDGKPARPYRVGTAVNETLILQSVAPRSAALASSAEAAVSFTLEMPKIAAP